MSNYTTHTAEGVAQVIAGRMMLNALRLEDFSDAFTLGKKLGKGTFAQVFEATAKVDSENLLCDEIALPRVFAVKRIDRESLSARAERRVYTEVRRRYDHDRLFVVSPSPYSAAYRFDSRF